MSSRQCLSCGWSLPELQRSVWAVRESAVPSRAPELLHLRCAEWTVVPGSESASGGLSVSLLHDTWSNRLLHEIAIKTKFRLPACLFQANGGQAASLLHSACEIGCAPRVVVQCAVHSSQAGSLPPRTAGLPSATKTWNRCWPPGGGDQVSDSSDRCVAGQPGFSAVVATEWPWMAGQRVAC